MDVEITPREIIASITIIAVMIIFGFIIGDKIQTHEMEIQQEYITAVQINEDVDMFKYGMKTNIGNAFVYGDWKAVDTVTHDFLSGEYSYIERVREEYCRHTRTVTKTKTVNGKTKTYTETEVYFTWDVNDRVEWHSQTIAFLGVEFPYGLIDRPATHHIDTEHASTKVRYQYYAAPAEAVGTIYANLSDNTISNVDFYINNSIEKVYDSLTTSFRVPLFWIGWILLTIAAIFGFYYLENNWLEE